MSYMISQTLTCYVVMFFLYVVMLGYSTACMTKMDGGVSIYLLAFGVSEKSYIVT